MKKSIKIILSVVMAIILCVAVFVGCKKQNDNNTDSSVATSSETSQIEESNTENKQLTEKATEQKTIQKRVVTAFNAVQGAVIYQTETDEYGYPTSCQFYKKCESCGYVSNSNGQARGNLSTSYHCEKCGNNQIVEITADEDYVEVPVN